MTEAESKVFDFIERHRGLKKEKVNLASCLCLDLGIAGDEADVFFEAFEKEFGVNCSELDLARYFGHEGMYPWQVLLIPLILLVGLCRKACGLTFHTKNRIEKEMKVSDLINAVTFGTWNGEFEQGAALNSEKRPASQN